MTGMSDSSGASSPLRYSVWQFALAAWCTLFVLGAAGELLGFDWLVRIGDVKQLFLN